MHRNYVFAMKIRKVRLRDQCNFTKEKTWARANRKACSFTPANGYLDMVASKANKNSYIAVHEYMEIILLRHNVEDVTSHKIIEPLKI